VRVNRSGLELAFFRNLLLGLNACHDSELFPLRSASLLLTGPSLNPFKELYSYQKAV